MGGGLGWKKGAVILTGAMAEIKANTGFSTAQKAP
jgi:hypothetical protein